MNGQSRKRRSYEGMEAAPPRVNKRFRPTIAKSSGLFNFFPSYYP